MLQIFTYFADWITFQVLNFDPASKLGQGVHFFIEDTSKIFVLLLVLIYGIAWIRASLKVERVRAFLQGKNRFLGYFLGALFGAITPFCSCSSIPLFMGFVSARIPIGVTMAFLITSPLINEVVIVLLAGLLGLKFTLIYVSVGLSLGIVGGIFFDLIRAERWLVPFLAKKYADSDTQLDATIGNYHEKMTFIKRHQFAKAEALMIFKSIWMWVIIGVGVGAFIHGFIPHEWVSNHLGSGQWWSVPLAALIGIPMYTNATAIVPVMGSLLAKGLPIGTTLTFCMSTVAASIPEFVMLKQVMSYRFLIILFIYFLISFTLVGWLFNAISL